MFSWEGGKGDSWNHRLTGVDSEPANSQRPDEKQTLLN